jgi:hypothetical protein
LAYGQPTPVQPSEDKVICLDPQDANTALRCLMEAPLKEDQVRILQDQLSNLQQESANCDATTAECMKLRELAEKEVSLYKEAYEREKSLTDRTMKLADEANKTKWGQLFGVGGIGLLIGIIFALLI